MNEYGEKQQENLSRQQNEGAGNIEENMFAEELLLLISAYGRANARPTKKNL